VDYTRVTRESTKEAMHRPLRSYVAD
jgi:hypothetical protein